MNTFPNFTSKVNVGGEKFNIHFVALFSEKADAIPIALFHGWPGEPLSFLRQSHHLNKTRQLPRVPSNPVPDETEVHTSNPPLPPDRSLITRLRILLHPTTRPRLSTLDICKIMN